MSAAVNEFLKKCAARVANKSERFTVVLGNEGGDMDSIIGSIYLALLLDSCEKFHLQPVVPAVNFPLDELPLRNDVQKIMEELNIDASLLSSVHPSSKNFLDLGREELPIVLYDHNKLKADQGQFGKQVAGIVDHHFDEKEYTEQTQQLRVIRTCGSACTLVAEMYREAGFAVPCPDLLLAPIILDTVNFEEAQKKVTPQDVEMYKWLCSEAKLSNHDHTAVFKKLSAWKNDIFCLTVEQNLKRDYKFFAFPCSTYGKPLNCGIASVPCSYAEFEEQYSLARITEDCKMFAKNNALDTVMIAFAGKKDGVHSRQVAFCAKEPCFSIFRDYATSAPGEVQFTETVTADLPENFFFVAYSLSDPAVSRKRLVPSLTNYLKDGRRSSL